MYEKLREKIENQPDIAIPRLHRQWLPDMCRDRYLYDSRKVVKHSDINAAMRNVLRMYKHLTDVHWVFDEFSDSSPMSRMQLRGNSETQAIANIYNEEVFNAFCRLASPAGNCPKRAYRSRLTYDEVSSVDAFLDACGLDKHSHLPKTYKYKAHQSDPDAKKDAKDEVARRRRSVVSWLTFGRSGSVVASELSALRGETRNYSYQRSSLSSDVQTILTAYDRYGVFEWARVLLVMGKAIDGAEDLVKLACSGGRAGVLSGTHFDVHEFDDLAARFVKNAAGGSDKKTSFFN